MNRKFELVKDFVVGPHICTGERPRENELFCFYE